MPVSWQIGTAHACHTTLTQWFQRKHCLCLEFRLAVAIARRTSEEVRDVRQSLVRLLNWSMGFPLERYQVYGVRDRILTPPASPRNRVQLSHTPHATSSLEHDHVSERAWSSILPHDVRLCGKWINGVNDCGSGPLNDGAKASKNSPAAVIAGESSPPHRYKSTSPDHFAATATDRRFAFLNGT
jgi:hypothetical protein